MYASPVYSSTKSVPETVQIQNCFSFFFFFLSQPSTLTQEVTQLKQPSIARIFPKNGPFVLNLKGKYSLR